MQVTCVSRVIHNTVVGWVKIYFKNDSKVFVPKSNYTCHHRLTSKKQCYWWTMHCLPILLWFKEWWQQIIYHFFQEKQCPSLNLWSKALLKIWYEILESFYSCFFEWWSERFWKNILLLRRQFLTNNNSNAFNLPEKKIIMFD